MGRAMQALSADMAGKVARQATAAGASVSRRAVRDAAPVDTGNLRAAVVMRRVRNTQLTEEYTVTVRTSTTRATRAGKAAGRSSDKAAQRKLQGKDAFYAKFVEFGTVKHAARPFIRPAFEGSVQPATEAVAKRLKQRIDKATGGGAA